MSKLYNDVGVTTVTVGTGTVTLGPVIDNSYFTADEAGVQNGDVVTYKISEGLDVEVGRGTYTSSGTTLSRDTVLISKIAGVAGTTKLTLAGTAQVRIVMAAEDRIEPPASSTDNAIARYDAASGRVVQNSAVTVADTTGILGFPTSGGFNFGSGNVTITHSADTLTFEAANGSAAPFIFTCTASVSNSPIAIFQNDGAGVPVDGDFATISLRLNDSGGTNTEYARLTWTGVDITDTTEDGSFTIGVMTAGSFANELVLDGAALSPFANDGLTLGTTALKWADLFLASGAVINFNSGNITVTHAAGTLTFAGTGANFIFSNLVSANDRLEAQSASAGTQALWGTNTADNASVLVLRLDGNRTTITDGDEAYMSLMLSDSAGTQTEFARITWEATDVTNTTEDGTLIFGVMTNAVLTSELQLDGAALSPFATGGIALGTTGLPFSNLFLSASAVINFGGDVTITHAADSITVAGATSFTLSGVSTALFGTANILMNDGVGIYWGAGTLSFTGTDAGDQVTLTGANTFLMQWNDDTANGMNWTSFKNSASPAANDYLGLFNFAGNTSTAVQATYAYFAGQIADPLNTSKDGRLVGAVQLANTLTEVFWIEGNGVRLLTTTALAATAAIGSIEVDANCFYGTTDAANRGYIPVRHFIRCDSARTLPNDANENPIFNSPANGTITLETGCYVFEALIRITGMSATSGNALIDILGAGTATAAAWNWYYTGVDATDPAVPIAFQSGIRVTQDSAASIVTAGTGTGLGLWIRGTCEITVAGTLIPSIDLVTATAGSVGIGSYFMIERVGSTSVVSVGQWT